MKPHRPIGVLRLIEPLLGRGRRRWRGGPFVPMIWRRRPGERAAAPQQGAARPSSVAPANVLNLTLVWPAGTAARAEPIRHFFETRTRELLRAGRDAGRSETNRLVTLVERLWLRSGNAGALPAANVPHLAAPLSSASARPHGPEASSGRQSTSPSTATAPRIWPHARRVARRTVQPPPAQAGSAGAAASGNATVIVRAERSPVDTRVPRIYDLRRTRAAAMGQGRGMRSAALAVAASGGKEPGQPVATRAPAAMMWTAADARAGSPAPALIRPSRPRTNLVWRKDEAGGENPTASTPAMRRTSGAELVWRRPSPVAPRDEGGSAHGAPAFAAGRGDVHARADRPVAYAAPASAPVAPAPAAIQPAEMSRLVDEVVRRLDRIGRDERMRRGL